MYFIIIENINCVLSVNLAAANIYRAFAEKIKVIDKKDYYMIDFKRITLSDKKDIDSCFAGNRCRTCDFSFTNLYSWEPKFKTLFSVIDHTLFLRFEGEKNEYYYMMPVGKMPLTKSLPMLIEDAKANGHPFIMKGVTNKMWELIQEAMPDTFKIENDRDNAEYLYFAEKMITLSGKKMQKKRNHINKFKAENHHWEYYPLILKEEISECIEMLNQWSGINKMTAETDDFDYIATRNMLDNFHALKLKGGALKVNGKIVAFTVGGPLTDDTFVVHIEKALSEVNGAYTMINQQFAEHEASVFTYINREEDMGIEGLRQAKMSYYPDILLEEGIVTFK